jgi:hypothetical protein
MFSCVICNNFIVGTTWWRVIRQRSKWECTGMNRPKLYIVDGSSFRGYGCYVSRCSKLLPPPSYISLERYFLITLFDTQYDANRFKVLEVNFVSLSHHIRGRRPERRWCFYNNNNALLVTASEFFMEPSHTNNNRSRSFIISPNSSLYTLGCKQLFYLIIS